MLRYPHQLLHKSTATPTARVPNSTANAGYDARTESSALRVRAALLFVPAGGRMQLLFGALGVFARQEVHEVRCGEVHSKVFESSLRTHVLHTGELYVITGPLFQGANISRLNGRVLVPTHVYKLVFDPKKNRGAAKYVKNEESDEMQIMSISDLEKLAGINFFPGLSASAMELIKDRA
jgi:hypothetical protein